MEGKKDEIVKALRNIEGIKYVRADMEREPGVFEYELEAAAGMDIRREVNRILREHDWPILMMRASDMTLEDIFLKITMGDAVAIHTKPADAKTSEGGAR